MSKNNNLLNIVNYNKELNNKDIIFHFNNIINEFLLHIVNQLVIKDNIHYKFILERGLDLLKNIFVMLLYYTKNIDLVNHHMRKSYLYYTEFIGQVGEDSNSFLQLNSKDACLFVYKKTIYDINEEYKKKLISNEDENQKINVIKEQVYFLITYIKMLLLNYIDKENKLMEDNKEIHLKEISQNTYKILVELSKINIEGIDKYKNIITFLNYIETKERLESDKIMYFFVKKIVKKDIDEKKIFKLILNDEEYSILTPIKFINKLFRE